MEQSAARAQRLIERALEAMTLAEDSLDADHPLYEHVHDQIDILSNLLEEFSEVYCCA